MRYTTLALWATALAGATASAHGHHHHRRHAHRHFARQDSLFRNGTDAETCLPVCRTIITSYLVDVEPATTVIETATVTPAEPTITTTSTELTTVTQPGQPVPTPDITTIEEPGTYTIPATTVTVTETTAVCVPETTSLPPGTQTYGGVTTVVTTSTTVVCPVPVVETTEGVVTSKVTTTTFVCPTAGTYTIGASTTVAPSPVVVEYPVVTVIVPGTYGHDDIVTTITETNYVVTCPLTTVQATATVVPVAPPTSTPEEEPEVVEPKTDKPATVVEETPAKEETPSTKPSGKAYAITYSPYNDDQSCKSAQDVDRDIKAIADKNFEAVRLYSSDCDGLKTVGGACEKYGLRLVLGIFIKKDGVGPGSVADNQLKDIIAWNKMHLVDFFVVGNEAIFQRFVDVHQLGGFINKCRDAVRAIGYNGPITTAEPINILKENKALCQYMDVVGLNIHPFFNPNCEASGAGELLAAQLKEGEEFCGKSGIVLEAGWPSGGASNGAAIPGKQQQSEAIASIMKHATRKIVYFTFRDDFWKDPGFLGVEQHFGIAQLF